MTLFAITLRCCLLFFLERYSRSICAILSALALSFSHVVQADRLQQPSLSTSLADHSLLLDLIRVDKRLFAVGERGHIIYSDDEGAEWKQASVPVSSSLTAIYFYDGSTGWAVGHDGVVLKSSDGGESWVKQLDGYAINDMVVGAYQQQMQSLQQQLKVLEEQGADSEDVQIAIEDLEIVLEDAQIAVEEGPTKPLLDLLFLSATHGWVIGSYGLILETADGGKSWHPVMSKLDNLDGFHLNMILKTSGGNLFIAGEGGALFRSEDSGKNWQRLDSPYEGSFYALMESQAEDELLVVGLRGRAYKSTDDGDNWVELDSATRSTLSAAVQLNNGDLLLAGASGSLSMATAKELRFVNYVEPLRRGFAAVVETAEGNLLLAGQGGITRVERKRLEEVRP